jgi:hypothetical protein
MLRRILGDRREQRTANVLFPPATTDSLTVSCRPAQPTA